MARLNKDDLAQMNKHYFQSLEKQRLVEVANNLHQLAVEQWERLEQNSRNQGEKRKPGKQPGAEGKWRTKPLVAEDIIPHYPEECASCNQELEKREDKPYMGYYVLELNPEKSGFQIVCQLHHLVRGVKKNYHIWSKKLLWAG